MFSLRDFYHLQPLDAWLERLIEGGPGLAVVAGLDSRPRSPAVSRPPDSRVDARPGMQAYDFLSSTGLLPSGRSAVISILTDLFLTKHSSATCQVVGESEHLPKVPRQFRRRMQVLPADPPYSYAGRIAAALEERPGLLVLDRLDGETAGLALEAAGQGLFVLAPLDTVFYGLEAAHHLFNLAAPEDRPAALRWVVSVQRLQTLCSECKQPAQPGEEHSYQLQMNAHRFNGLEGFEDLAQFCANPEGLQMFRPVGCDHCGGIGRSGEVTVFDVFYNPDIGEGSGAGLPGNSVLPVEAYVGKLALLGRLSLSDFLNYETEHHRRVGYSLLVRETMLADTAAAHERKLAELEAANRVLQERTRSLVALQEIGLALISSVDLRDFANLTCRFAQDLCGADRVIVYYLHSQQDAEVLAFGGWSAERVPERVDPSPVFAFISRLASGDGTVPSAYKGWPPGIPPRHPDVEGAELRAGLYLPLMAHDKCVGFILAHTTRKPAFSPKEASLLTTLAQQVALGIQRARLVDDLTDKIARLEAAQAELAKKERLERDLELARQVQQSMLPREFPVIQGFLLAARNEPARQVGGDFYDVILLDDNRFGVAIADASDKGLPAALYMALTRSLLRAEARRQPSPRQVLSNVNRLLLELGDGRSFVTLFYGVVEQETRRMTYSRAGHERPLLLRQEGLRAWTAEFLGGDGTPLGILDVNFRLSEETVQLTAGDRLVLYTDGLTDVANPSGELFGLKRLAALLAEVTDRPLDLMCAVLYERLLAYQGETEQFDDMSALLLEVE